MQGPRLLGREPLTGPQERVGWESGGVRRERDDAGRGTDGAEGGWAQGAASLAAVGEPLRAVTRRTRKVRAAGRREWPNTGVCLP